MTEDGELLIEWGAAMLSALRGSGQASEASMVLEHMIKLRRQMHPTHRRDRPGFGERLSDAYGADGPLAEAVCLLQRTVQGLQQSPPDPNHEAIVSKYTSSLACYAGGEFEECIMLTQVAFPSVDKNSPMWPRFQYLLGLAHRQNGDIAKAVNNLEQVAHIWETTLHEGHHDRLCSLHQLALVHQDVGLINKSVEFLERLHGELERTLPQGHLHRLESQQYLTEARELVTIGDRSGLLFTAVNKGYVEAVQCLVRSGVAATVVNKNGWTPITIASALGHVKVVQCLIDNDVDASVPGFNDEHLTPLHAASFNGQANAVQCLINNGVPATVVTVGGCTPFYGASFHGHVNVVQCFIDNDLVSMVADNGGRTPLHAASFYGHAEIVRLLLEQGADTNATCLKGKTPLQYASDNGHAAVVNMLLGSGATNDSSDNSGQERAEEEASGWGSRVFQSVWSYVLDKRDQWSQDGS